VAHADFKVGDHLIVTRLVLPGGPPSGLRKSTYCRVTGRKGLDILLVQPYVGPNPTRIFDLDKADGEWEVSPHSRHGFRVYRRLTPPATIGICFAFRDSGVCGRVGCPFRH
jgi:hypothetical protein